MLNKLIRWSLHHRPLILAASVLLVIFGYQTIRQLPVEVLPDMTKPTVTVLTECPGLAPEEVEKLVTQPIEGAVQGVAGLDRLRSNSGRWVGSQWLSAWSWTMPSLMWRMFSGGCGRMRPQPIHGRGWMSLLRHPVK